MAFVFLYGPDSCSSRINSQKFLDGAAEVIDKARTVEEYDIVFDVYNESNKCAGVNITLTEGRKVWGVVYKIPDELLKDRDDINGQITLPQIKGKRYYKKNILVEKSSGEIIKAVTFPAREPYRYSTAIATTSEYLYWIIAGLKEHKVPPEYIEHVREKAIENNKKAIRSIEEEIESIKKL